MKIRLAGPVAAVAVLAALAGGCESPPPYVPAWVMERSEYGRPSALDRAIESEYLAYLEEIKGARGIESDPMATRQDLIERIRAKYEDEAEKSLYSIIVGLPPRENKVGYLEKVEYPQVMLYDRDMGVFDQVRIVMWYVYDLELEEPAGIITESGLTVKFRTETELDDSRLGYFTPPVGAVFILGVCPSTGAVLRPEWLDPQVRVDIDTANLTKIKEVSAREITRLHEYYRTVKDLDPSFYKSVQGFLVVEDGKYDWGTRDVIPIRLVELREKDFHGKALDRAPIPGGPGEEGPPAAKGGGETPEKQPAEDGGS